MPLLTTLASLSQTPASNAADGSVDAPSTLDNQVNLLASFIAQLRDGNGFATGAGNVGQCRFVKFGSNLLLQPFLGNGLTINGVVQKIPAAGVSLAPTGTPLTLYYIYAYMVGTVMTLEASATGHSTDTTTGVEIKTGDVTRTLVGMARPIAGPAWQDAIAQRFVVSWFNRRPNSTLGVYTADRTTPTSEVSFTELASEIRNEFLSWSGVTVTTSLTGHASSSPASAGTMNYFTGIGIDVTTGGSTVCAVQVFDGAFVGTRSSSISQSFPTTLTEGYHWVTLMERCVSTASTTYQYPGSSPGAPKLTVSFLG